MSAAAPVQPLPGVAVGTGDGVTLGEMLGADSETLNYGQLPVGYPAALPAPSNVPEPSTVALMLTGLMGLFFGRRQGRSAGSLSG